MQVIINADDLGMTREVNDAIFALIAGGRITSSTVMANGFAWEDAALRAKAFPQCSFGAHLNATQFQPLAVTPGLKPLLDGSGNFSENQLREVNITRELQAALLIEWKAQVMRLCEAGFRISHFDSHHHVHTIPGVFPVLKQLQRLFNIRKVRLSRNYYLPETPVPITRHLAKAVWKFALKNYFKTKTTDGFTSLDVFLKKADQININYCIELQAHPGNIKYQTETQMFGCEWVQKLPFPIKLISYDGL